MINLKFQYKPLFTIKVNHNYFPEDELDDFYLVPTRRTVRLIDKMSMLVRNKAGEIHVLYDVSKTELLQLNLESTSEVESKFSFLLFSKNQYFVNITDVPVDLNNKVFYCSNKHAGLKRNATLHNDKFLGSSDLYDIQAQEIQNDQENDVDYKITQEDGRDKKSKSVTPLDKGKQIELDKLIEGHYKIFRNDEELSSFINIGRRVKGSPIGYVEIFFNNKLKQKVIREIEGSELETFNYSLYFNARSVFWKYLIVPIYMKRLKKLAVTTQNGSEKIPFKNSGEEEINGKKAVSFVSEQPIQFKKYQDIEIQLKKKEGEGAAKTLMKKLPYAPFDLIKPIDKENYTSEIFVYI